jgi:hypothetical protein
VAKGVPDEFRKGADRYNSWSNKTYLHRAIDSLARAENRWGRVEVNGIWSKVSPDIGKRFAEKLDKVRFIHGDMQALKEYGPFDLFYASNALQGGNGNVRTPLKSKIHDVMKKGGFVVTAGAASHSGWKSISSEHRSPSYGDPFTGTLSWSYHLYEVQ